MAARSASTRSPRYSLRCRGRLVTPCCWRASPDELVVVEVRGIAREGVELEPAALCLDELGNQMGSVRRMAVDQEEDRLPAPPQERLEKCPVDGRVQPVGDHHVPEGFQRAHGGDRGPRLPLAAGRDDRGRTAGRLGSAQGRVRADPGFVEEEDRRPALLGAAAQRRVAVPTGPRPWGPARRPAAAASAG